MLKLNCQLLAEITGGEWTAGMPPPLHGRWQPFQRLALDSELVQPGDAYLHVAGYPSPQRGCCPEEAYHRGAAVVITANSRVEPWAGASRVLVACPYAALLSLGRWWHAVRCCRTVVICGEQAPHMAMVLTRCSPKSAFIQAHTSTELIQQLWTPAICHADAVFAALTTSSPHELSLSLAIARADMVIYATPWHTPTAAALQPTLDGLDAVHMALYPVDATTCLVDCRGEAAMHAAKPFDFASAPRHAPLHHAGRHCFPVSTPNQVAKYCATDCRSAAQWAATWLAGRLLGISPDILEKHFRDAIHKSARTRSTHRARTQETPLVPPLVSDTRESDTTLPPGVKRSAA
ncbi:MAG: hypothetical protein KatS3mg110_4285 [Pirellulaceae bacterium]|nr:MAG: hypothetical protein KatS3mg110_4285 [Pirellulaceae bacterium]